MDQCNEPPFLALSHLQRQVAFLTGPCGLCAELEPLLQQLWLETLAQSALLDPDTAR